MLYWSRVFLGLMVFINYYKIDGAHHPYPVLTLDQPPKLQVEAQWELANYNFEWDAPTNDKNFYNPENIVATGIAATYDRIFVATARLFSGVPATLSVIQRNRLGEPPVLEAYPDWSFHTISRNSYNCSDLGLVSVYRFRIDRCNRLWALDAGVSRSLEDYEVTCRPKILIFDLNTNQVVRRIDFPREVLRGESLFTNLIIDETTSDPSNKCDDAFVYISDTVEPAIVVYDSGRDITWRVSHPAMYPDPDFAQSNIRGDKFVLMDGVVGLAFDEKSGTVYFQPLATDRVFSISKNVLRSGPIAINQVLPVKLVGKKSSQGLALTVAPTDGKLIFSPLSETAIAAWDPRTNQQRILAEDEESLQFVADFVFAQYDPQSLFAITSKFQRFFLKTLNPREINTRIIKLSYAPSIKAYTAHQPPQTAIYNQQILLPYSLTDSLTSPRPNFNTQQYFTSIRQPFQYQPVGTSNRGIKNHFTPLNLGEQFGIDQPQIVKINPEYISYNTLRFGKNLLVNSSNFFY